MVQTILNVLLILLAIAAIVLVILYFLGSKLQKRQAEQQQMLDAAAQTVSILVIDKKKMKMTEAGFPKMVVDQTPKYMRWAKVPVVKAKIGPKVMTLIADAGVFESLPVKTEAKVVLSGIYITQIKSVRGGAIPAPPKKKGFFASLIQKQPVSEGFRRRLLLYFFFMFLFYPDRTMLYMTAHPRRYGSPTYAHS